MKHKRFLAWIASLTLVFLLLALGLYLQNNSSTDQREESAKEKRWEKAFEYAKEQLPKEGVLRRKRDGFVYLKVDDRYIHALFPLLDLKKEGFRKPPYFRSFESPGAHISVFDSKDKVRPKEIGQTFSFELKKITVVHPSAGTSYVILELDAKELESLREKYGFPPKIRHHEFHISLGKQLKAFSA